MNFQQLSDAMRQANKEGKKITGYVVVSANSLKPQFHNIYHRTYIFTSDNKYWNDRACSNSIWADCLDGEKGIKLSEYICGPRGWSVDSCGLVFYALPSAYEREIMMSVHPTLDEAQREMRKQFTEGTGATPEKMNDNEDYGEFGFSAYSAWVNDSGHQDGNFDWKIFRMFFDGLHLDQEDTFLMKGNKGYLVSEFTGTGMFEIEKDDSTDIFEDDEEAVRQAIRDGIKCIPVEELPENFEFRYLGWVDTEENRAAINRFCFCKGGENHD